MKTEGSVLPLTASASSSDTRKTATRSVPILADSKAVTELQRNHKLTLAAMNESMKMCKENQMQTT